MKAKLRRRWIHLLVGLGVLVVSWGTYSLLRPHPKIVHNFDQCVAADYTLSSTDPQYCTDLQGHKFTNSVATTSLSPARTALDFDTLVISTNGPAKPERTVITNQPDWQAFWRRIHAHLPSRPTLIPVDFSKKQVVAVMSGQHSSPGYYLKIEEIATQADIVLVSVHESSPPKGCVVPGAPSSPYHIVQFDKTNLPVRFSVTSTNVAANCTKK